MKLSLQDPYPTCDPSRFIHRITFLQATSVMDASGNSTVYVPASPPDVTYAEILQLRGTDVIRSGQDTSKVFATIKTYYRPDRGSDKRIQVPSGDVYIVQAVENPRLMNVYLVFTCLLLGAN